VSWVVDGAITGAALAGWGVLELGKDALVPPTCRWCSTWGLDATVRNAVRWSDTTAAETASDVLQFAVPVGVAAYGVAAAGDIDTAGKNVLLIVEAVSISAFLTQGVKFAAARITPHSYYSGLDVRRDDHLSFWSGHAAAAFSAAAAGGTLARLRGYESWPWVYAAGFTGAALTGYFRMAGDQHWLTDVLASAVFGTSVGILVPWLHRASDGTGFRLLPAPGGLVVKGDF
jgi:membrane-associated phospholipid phosphatase